MRIDFDGKVILVTGSSKGLGLSFAKCLDKAGAKVVLNGRAPYSEELATNFEQAGIDSFYVSCPVELSEELISQVIDKFGRIDGLVHNAGFLRDKTLKKMSDADWSKVIEAHLSSAFRLVRSAWPHFEKSWRWADRLPLFGNWYLWKFWSSKLCGSKTGNARSC